jgi:hypothetical protein
MPHVSAVDSVRSPSSGPEVMTVSGGPESIAKLRVWSDVLPALSVARTVSV